MSNLKVDLTKGDGSINVAIDWLTKPFDDMVKNIGPINRKALNTAAYIIKDKVKETFTNKMPAAGRPFNTIRKNGNNVTSKGGYKITKSDCLVDAVKQSSATEFITHVFMGGRDPGSPLFIARMYNKGTKNRYQKLYAGKKLNKKRFIGHLDGKDYWDPGIIAGQTEALNAINRIYENYTEKYMNEN